MKLEKVRLEPCWEYIGQFRIYGECPEFGGNKLLGTIYYHDGELQLRSELSEVPENLYYEIGKAFKIARKMHKTYEKATKQIEKDLKDFNREGDQSLG